MKSLANILNGIAIVVMAIMLVNFGFPKNVEDVLLVLLFIVLPIVNMIALSKSVPISNQSGEIPDEQLSTLGLVRKAFRAWLIRKSHT